MSDTKLMMPTVHMNGTNGKTLFREYSDAMNAVQNAIEVMGKVTLHGRDYYVDPNPNAFETARDQFNARFGALIQVKTELEEIAVNLMEQIGIDNLID